MISLLGRERDVLRRGVECRTLWEEGMVLVGVGVLH